MSARSPESSADEQDQQWRRLRRANTVRLILYAGIAVLFAIGWLAWFIAKQDPGSSR